MKIHNLQKQKFAPDIWLEWLVEVDMRIHKFLRSSNFRLTNKSSNYKLRVSLPLVLLHCLAQDRGWLSLLRNPQHIPLSPTSLVRFIKLLEKF